MEINILLFGITKEIIGSPSLRYPLREPMEVGELLADLQAQYPRLKGLASLLVAVNDEYAEPTYRLKAQDELALIPPVSGG